MKVSAARRFLAGPVLPISIGAALMAGAGWFRPLAPHGPLGDPWVSGGAALLAVAAGLHRPLGGAGLGLGAFVLPAVLALAGGAPAAWVAALALAALELAHRWLTLSGPNPPPERRRLLRSFETAISGGLSTLGAAGAWLLVPLDGSAPPLLTATGFAAGAYLLLTILFRWLARLRYRPRSQPGLLGQLAPLAIDLAGWGLGAGFALMAIHDGPLLAGGLGLAAAAISLEAFRNARLLGVAQQRVNEIEDVGRAGQRVITGGSELAALAESIRVECRRIVPFRWFQFELLAAGQKPQSWMAGPEGAVREGVPQPERSPPALPGIHRRRPWRLLSYPLEVQESLLGRVRLWCDPRHLDGSEEDLLEALKEQLATSVHRALLDRDARLDPLTGVSVRRVLERGMDAFYQRVVDEGGAMAVVICDIDHFKRINDTFGHAAGDRALQAVAKVLANRVKGTDLCCRWGGEEFVLLLPEADGGTGLAVAERVRREIEALSVATEDGCERLPITLSAGVAAFPDLYVESPGELIELADGALYEAKRRGRNLCLLDLGRGRYRDPGGRVHAPAQTPEPAAVPRLFA